MNWNISKFPVLYHLYSLNPRVANLRRFDVRTGTLVVFVSGIIDTGTRRRKDVCETSVPKSVSHRLPVSDRSGGLPVSCRRVLGLPPWPVETRHGRRTANCDTSSFLGGLYESVDSWPSVHRLPRTISTRYWPYRLGVTRCLDGRSRPTHPDKYTTSTWNKVTGVVTSKVN